MRYAAIMMLLAVLAVPFVGGCKKEQPPQEAPPAATAETPAEETPAE